MGREIAATVRELMKLKQTTGALVLERLRSEGKPDPRTRIEKIRAAHPSDYEMGVSSVGGNSNIYLFNKRGRRTERFISGTNAYYLRKRGEDFCIALYTYGVAGLTEAGQPIFEDPDTTQRVSVVIEYEEQALDHTHPWLQRRIEPLFNVDIDGTVFARISDQPTPTELAFLGDILDRFESVI